MSRTGKVIALLIVTGCVNPEAPEFSLSVPTPTEPQSAATGTPTYNGVYVRYSPDAIQRPQAAVINPTDWQIADDLEVSQVSLSDIARTVYVDQLGMSLVTVGALDVTVQWSSKDAQIGNLRSAIEAAISAAGYSVEYSGNAAIVSDGTGLATNASAIVKLTNIRPALALETLQSTFPTVAASMTSRGVLVTGAPRHVTSAQKMISALDVDSISETPWAVVRIPRSIAREAAEVIATIGMVSGPMAAEVYPIGETGVVFVVGYTRQGVDHAVSVLRGLSSGLEGKVTALIPSLDVEGMSGALEALYSEEVAAGDLVVTPVASSGAVAIRGVAGIVSKARAFAQTVTPPETWVSVKAVIAETQAGSAVDRGVTFAYSAGGISFGAGIGGTDPAVQSDARALALGVASGGFSAALSWLETDGQTKILATPSVSVRSGGEAFLNVGSQVPILEQQVVNNEELTTLSQTIVYRDTGVNLRVAPIVQRDGSIAIDVEQEISNTVSNTFSTVDSPVFDRRLLQTQVSVRSGELAVVAGLDSQQFQADNGGILIDVLPPVLESRSSNSTKMFILLTADIQGVQQRGRAAETVLANLRGAFNGG